VLAVNATTGRVSVVGAGTATITVRQASSANYEAGSESLTVQIGRATPTLSSFSAVSKDYGDAPFSLTPPESDSPAPFTYESSAPTVASINSTTGVVTILNVTTVGSPVTLTIRQAQTDNYAAITATTTLIVGRGTPVFGDFAITTKVWGASNFSATAPTSTSAGAFTYNIVDVDGVNEAAIATITSAGIITVTGPGSVQVRATQAANTLYVSSSITATFTVTSATPSFGTFGSRTSCTALSLRAARRSTPPLQRSLLRRTRSAIRTACLQSSQLSVGESGRSGARVFFVSAETLQRPHKRQPKRPYKHPPNHPPNHPRASS
jgi:hypothetical protein